MARMSALSQTATGAQSRARDLMLAWIMISTRHFLVSGPLVCARRLLFARTSSSRSPQSPHSYTQSGCQTGLPPEPGAAFCMY